LLRCITVYAGRTGARTPHPQARSPSPRFDGLNAVASAKVTAALYQLAVGNWSNVNGVGAGIFERKIDVRPGYWVYLGKDGDRLMILLGGKQRQQQAIETSQERWADYLRRKVKEKL
jgi:putative addiction module killer protein